MAIKISVKSNKVVFTDVSGSIQGYLAEYFKQN